ncbi:MAG: translation initiation factor IF-3 [Solirubrobacteraceae bacterium]
MAVPRRLDRRPPEQDLTRINERIGAPEVRLIDEQGQQIGVIKTGEALRFARERDLDLVEVAPLGRPPVCRVLDYSKYKYEQAQKQKQARKHQQQITIREIKFRPKIAQHDYDTKKGHVTRFLLSKFKVKVTIMFRGREVSHPERGVSILKRLAEELVDVGVVEQSPTLEGRNMAMLLAPSKGVMNGQITPASARAAANGEVGPETLDGDGASAGPDAAPVEDAPLAADATPVEVAEPAADATPEDDAERHEDAAPAEAATAALGDGDGEPSPAPARDDGSNAATAADEPTPKGAGRTRSATAGKARAPKEQKTADKPTDGQRPAAKSPAPKQASPRTPKAKPAKPTAAG